jgi:hypothetical protein
MGENNGEFIERRILTGLIVSTPFITQIQATWDSKLLASATARILADWCTTYFKKYTKAPGRDIEGIFTAHLPSLPLEKAEWIEEVLGSLSDEYERGQFNDQYLLDQTREYLRERKLLVLADTIKGELAANNIVEAEKLASGYTPLNDGNITYVDPFTDYELVKRAFAEREKPLFTFPGALGEFWNDEFIRGKFVALMGPEKRGKSFFIMEIAIAALKAGCKVALFQAGDMSAEEFTLRLATRLAGKSYKEKYCGTLYIPTKDCVLHQIDVCNSNSREPSDGKIFATEDYCRKATYDDLVARCIEYPKHRCCYNCKEHFQGTVWFRVKEAVNPLTHISAYKAMRDFRVKYGVRFRLSSHPSGTLTVAKMKGLMNLWELQDGFVSDVVLDDYSDIHGFEPSSIHDPIQDRINATWMAMRGLSQERHCLVITATQTDAESYTADLLGMMNFSRDKRKYGHVTAMYGLNQKPEEKNVGVMRINEIVVREAGFDTRNTVKVLQRLEMGRAFLESYR